MKKLIFSLAAIGLLGANVNAQVAIAGPQAPESPRSSVKIAVGVGGSVEVNRTENSTFIQDTQDGGDTPKRTKTFSKTFSLDNSDKVSLSNQYGTIVIKTWDRKEIKADIVMEAYSNSEKEAQSLIDDVSIDAGKNGDVVSIKTNLSDGNYGKRVNNGRITWHREVKVNYTIYMPSSNALTAATQYGSITVPDFSAPTSFKVQYGNLTAGKLANTNNYINVQYGKINVEEVGKANVKYQYGGGLVIGTAGSIDLNVQYASANITTVKGNVTAKVQYGGGLTIGSMENIDLDAQYVNVKLNNVNGTANIDQQYNSITFGTVGKVTLGTQYTNVTIGTLKGDATFKMDYNKLTINEVTAACRNLNVRTTYVNSNIGFAGNYNANFDVQTEYANFKYGSNVTAKRVRDDDDEGYSSDKAWTGKIGSGGAAVVKIKAEYGGVTFK